jgi:hypothetical protein
VGPVRLRGPRRHPQDQGRSLGCLSQEGQGRGKARKGGLTTVFYHRLIRGLAGFFDCEPEEEILLAVRRQRDATQLAGALLRAANVKALLVDTRYPPPQEVLS